MKKKCYFLLYARLVAKNRMKVEFSYDLEVKICYLEFSVSTLAHMLYITSTFNSFSTFMLL